VPLQAFWQTSRAQWDRTPQRHPRHQLSHKISFECLSGSKPRVSCPLMSCAEWHTEHHLVQRTVRCTQLTTLLLVCRQNVLRLPTMLQTLRRLLHNACTLQACQHQQPALLLHWARERSVASGIKHDRSTYKLVSHVMYSNNLHFEVDKACNGCHEVKSISLRMHTYAHPCDRKQYNASWWIDEY
jgi:hypothetical protein